MEVKLIRYYLHRAVFWTKIMQLQHNYVDQNFKGFGSSTPEMQKQNDVLYT